MSNRSPDPHFLKVIEGVRELARAKSRRENIRDIVSFVGMVGLLITLGLNSWSLRTATQSLDAARLQIDQGRYQSVYQQQLAMWNLAASKPELAEVIVGGPPEEAARTLATDLYAYIFAQLAPRYADGTVVGLALDHSDVDKPWAVTDEEWANWRSWSYTIAYGFINNQDLCTRLNDAYDESFRAAIRQARVPADTNRQDSELVPLCKPV